jgi:hypothetical protein
VTDKKDDRDPSAEPTEPAPLVLTPSPSEVTKTPGPPPPVVQQPLSPFGGGFPSQTLAVSVTNAEMEVLRKVTPEHISQEMQLRHERDMRRIGLQEKDIEVEREQAKDDLTRDQRDREDLKRTDGRLERMFYVVLGSVVVICTTLIATGHPDIAVKVIGAFVAVLVALLGGVGVESLRRARKSRSTRRRARDDEERQDAEE